MTEFTQEFSNQVFGRTPAQPEPIDTEPPAPSAPVIRSQGAAPKTGNSNPSSAFINQLFDRTA